MARTLTRPMDLGQAIRQMRQAKGLSQGHIAKRIDRERPYVSDLERGVIKNPYFDTVAEIARAIGVSIDDIVDLAEELARKGRQGQNAG